MTKWDKMLIFFIIIISLSGLYFVKEVAVNEGAQYIRVEVNGKEYKKISLGANMEGKTIEVKTEYGFNKIEIGKNKVRMIESDCHDQLCVKQGWINAPGNVVVCLPNRLVIELEGSKESKVDEISH
ncbi:MAG: NusG domain II-containing protein [Firmicutes bacterium]|nr:NusG domain II-containing protein [Bacillota bacterium]